MSDRYLSLATFKKDGSAVETPMWFVGVGDKLYMFTDGTSYKVKRLRRDQRASIAPCTANGSVTGGWTDRKARIVDDPATARRVYSALTAKYGWQMRLLNLGSTLAGRIGRREVIELSE
jgi:PPOX class probable F420-dependent enzyme